MRIRTGYLIFTLLILTNSCSSSNTQVVKKTEIPTDTIIHETISPFEEPSSTPQEVSMLPRQKIAYFIDPTALWIYDPMTGVSSESLADSVYAFDWFPDGHNILLAAWSLEDN